jgi:hypothetical protein
MYNITEEMRKEIIKGLAYASMKFALENDGCEDPKVAPHSLEAAIIVIARGNPEAAHNVWVGTGGDWARQAGTAQSLQSADEWRKANHQIYPILEKWFGEIRDLTAEMLEEELGYCPTTERTLERMGLRPPA